MIAETNRSRRSTIQRRYVWKRVGIVAVVAVTSQTIYTAFVLITGGIS